MITRIATLLTPEKTLEKMLDCRVEAVTWEYNDETGKIANPQIDYIQLPLRIPTPLSKSHNTKNLLEKVDSCREQIQKKYAELLRKTEAELSLLKPGTKARKSAEQKADAIRGFLAGIHSRIRLEGPLKRYESIYSAYHLITPHFPSTERPFLEDFFITYKSFQETFNLMTEFPFCILEKTSAGYVPLRKRVAVKALCAANAVALDFETHNWKKIHLAEELGLHSEEELKRAFIQLASLHKIDIPEKHLAWLDRRDFLRGVEELVDAAKGERLTVASMMNLSGESYLITTLDCGKDVIEVDVPGQNRKAAIKVVRVSDQAELIEGVNKRFSEDEPLFCYGHYQMKFDYGKAEELTSNFRPGVGGRKPKHVSQVPGGFIVQKIIPGRIDIDPSGYAQHYMFSFNNKLDTVLEHVTGIQSKKTMTHAELIVKTRAAEDGSRADAFDILYYAAQDAMKSYIIGDKLKLEHILLAEAFDSLPSRIDTTSKKTLAMNYWENQLWRMRHTFPRSQIGNEKTTFETSHGKEFIRFDDFSVLDNFKSSLEKNCAIKTQRGMQEGYLIALFPYSAVFRNILVKDPKVKQIYERCAETSDEREKFRLKKALEAIAEYPLFSSISCHDVKFSARFGLPGDNNLKGYVKAASESVAEIAEFFSKHMPINTNSELFIIPASADGEVVREFAARHGGVFLGKGKFLSGTKGRFAGNLNSEFIMQGIADYHSNKGERCRFEKAFYENFLRMVVMEGDNKSAFEYLASQARLLKDGKLAVEEVEYKREARKDHTDYSSGATQRYIVRMAEQQTRKGELVKYEYSLPEMQNKFFGISSQPASQPRVTSGSISELVQWVFNFKRGTKERQILERTYLGEVSQQEIDSLFAPKLEQGKLF